MDASIVIVIREYKLIPQIFLLIVCEMCWMGGMTANCAAALVAVLLLCGILNVHAWKVSYLLTLLPVSNDNHSAAFLSCIMLLLRLFPKTVVFALSSKMLCQSILL